MKTIITIGLRKMCDQCNFAIKQVYVRLRFILHRKYVLDQIHKVHFINDQMSFKSNQLYDTVLNNNNDIKDSCTDIT